MFSLLSLVVLALLTVASVVASPIDSVHHVFQSRSSPDTRLRFVRNSGVCETTPGVNQISGYIDVGTNMSMVCYLFHFVTSNFLLILLISLQWFWFFEARHNPETAPFTLWFVLVLFNAARPSHRMA